MVDAADNVTFNPEPIKVGLVWGLVVTHALSGQQEHVLGFHSPAEAKQWLASNGCVAWLKTRGYSTVSQDGTRSRIYVMDLMACWTGHRLIDVAVLRNIFGTEALHAVSGFGAAVHEERHVTASRSASQNGLI